jgi:hypothetical protein
LLNWKVLDNFSGDLPKYNRSVTYPDIMTGTAELAEICIDQK